MGQLIRYQMNCHVTVVGDLNGQYHVQHLIVLIVLKLR